MQYSLVYNLKLYFAVDGVLADAGEVLVIVQHSHPANLAQLEAEPSACSLPVFMRTGLCLLEVSATVLRFCCVLARKLLRAILIETMLSTLLVPQCAVQQLI